MAENDLGSPRVRLELVAENGSPEDQGLGPHLAALAGPKPAAALRGADDILPRATPHGKHPDAVRDESDWHDHAGPSPEADGRQVAADGPPPVAPGPSVKALLTPRTRWEEERPADVVQMPTHPAEDRRRDDRPGMLGVVAPPETLEREDVDRRFDADGDTRGARPIPVRQPDGREDPSPRAVRPRLPSGALTIGLPQPRRSTALIAAAAIAGILTIAGLSLFRASGPPDQAAPPTPASAAANDVIMDTWRGMDLPVSAESGPFAMGETHVSGFARTELGAAVAAAHLSVRLDPAAGPPTFEAVLEDQVVGDVDRMAAAVRGQYRAEATREQQAAGQPLPVTPGRLVGWRTDGDLGAGAVTVHLAVQDPAGARSDFAVPLRWTGGDWSVDAAESGPFFHVTALSGDYRDFMTGEGL